MRPFHLAIPAYDLQAMEEFYVNILGCSKGRQDERWLDLNFFGHQLSMHLCARGEVKVLTNSVDDKQVPINHFGVILEWQQWQELAEKLQANNMEFIIEPYIRFQGKVGEQATMFFNDPSGNALEFKAFKDDGQIFAN